MYTYQQRLEYAHRLQMLQRAVVIKDNIHLTYQYKNRNKAYNNIDTVQDRINKAIIDDAVNGNGANIKNLDKQGEKLIHDTLTNERKRLHRDKNHKAVNQSTKSNSQYYTNIFNYRRKKIGESLSDKIENELRTDALKDLSDMDKIKHLREKFDGHGTKRLKNIVTDAMHTNESNIGWIKAVEDGFNYKVWKNGRVAKGRTRAWHKEKIISAVPIDETFDIYGSYPAHMMYPGDLNGGAENVANCRCWLLYTNRIPSNLRSKTVFNVSPTFQDIWDNARKPANKLKTTIKKPINKLRKVSSKISGKLNSKKSYISGNKQNRSKLTNLFSLNKSSSKNTPNKTLPKTPSFKDEKVFADVNVSYTKKSMSKFKTVVKKKYLDDVLKHFEYFKSKLNVPNENRDVEHCTIRKADGTIVEFYTSGQKKNVDIPEDIQEEGRKNYIHTAIHNHPEGTSPISSPEDISKYAECGVINGISHNELGTMIITNNNVNGNKQKFNEIEEKIESIKEGMITDFRINANNGYSVDLDNPDDVRRLNRYVDKHAMKYVSKYKKALKPYKIKVKFIGEGYI